MNKIKIKNNLPVGMAWVWVKSSFAIFREKPINFLFFALMLIMFSFVPLMGGFFATLVILRIILSANYVEKGEQFGISLNFGMIIRQRNLFSFAIFSLAIDFLLMSLVSEILTKQGVDPTSFSDILADPNIIYVMFAVNVLKIIIIGISPTIMIFNPHIRVFTALKLNLIFIFKNLVVLSLAVFLLLPFIVIPLYLFSLLAFSMTNPIAFGVIIFFLIIFLLVAINVVNIFSYKIYKDCIIYE